MATYLESDFTGTGASGPAIATYSFWVKLERLKKPEDRIFTTEEVRLTKQKEVREAIDKGLIDPNISETAGNYLHTKKDFTEQQLFDFFRPAIFFPPENIDQEASALKISLSVSS